MTQLIRIEDIKVDPSVQVRECVDEQVVKHYTSVLERGEKFKDPIVVFRLTEDNTYLLSDGFRRLEASKRAGKTDIETEVRDGTKRDAILAAVEENCKNGQILEKRRAITVLLLDPIWSQWNNCQIARVCGVSDVYVGRIRKELELSSNQFDDADQGRLVERGGTTYRQKRRRKKQAGKVQSAKPEPPVMPEAGHPTQPEPIPAGKTIDVNEVSSLTVGELAAPRPESDAANVPKMDTTTNIGGTASHSPPKQRASQFREEHRHGFEVIFIEPLWERWTTEKMRKWTVNELAAENCSLWLRVPCDRFPDALDIIKHWGFDYHTLVSQVQMREGSKWLLANREVTYFVVATRGQKHGVKGSILMDGGNAVLCEAIEGMCPGRKIHLYATAEREGWTYMSSRTATQSSKVA